MKIRTLENPQPGFGKIKILIDRLINDPNIEEHVLEYLRYIEETSQNQNNYIDHGGAAVVYGFPDREICFKIMKNRHASASPNKYILSNAPEREFDAMERLDGFSTNNVRSPVPEMCIESGETSIIVMEKLSAINFQHMINGSVSFPDGFNFDNALDDLQEYIERLHSEMNLAHGDLYPRNIMLDPKTLQMFVIDFATASPLSNLTHEQRKKIEEEDWERYDELVDILYSIKDKKVTQKLISPTLEEREFDFGSNLRIKKSQKLLARCKKLAEGLIATKDEKDYAYVELGDSKSLIVTTNKKHIKGAWDFDIEGVTFYVGVIKNFYELKENKN